MAENSPETTETKTVEETTERKTEEPKREELTSERFDEVKREAIENRRKLRAAETAHDQTRKELEQLRSEHESGQEKAVREAVEQERERWQRLVVEAQVAAGAAGKLQDPADAVALVSVEELLAETDEEKRQQLLDKQLDELVERKPYLALNGTREQEGGRQLVTQGARSRQPVSGDKNPDDWIRSRGRRRR